MMPRQTPTVTSLALRLPIMANPDGPWKFRGATGRVAMLSMPTVISAITMPVLWLPLPVLLSFLPYPRA